MFIASSDFSLSSKWEGANGGVVPWGSTFLLFVSRFPPISRLRVSDLRLELTSLSSSLAANEDDSSLASADLGEEARFLCLLLLRFYSSAKEKVCRCMLLADSMSDRCEIW